MGTAVYPSRLADVEAKTQWRYTSTPPYDFMACTGQTSHYVLYHIRAGEVTEVTTVKKCAVKNAAGSYLTQ
jgi:hypothetical protein